MLVTFKGKRIGSLSHLGLILLDPKGWCCFCLYYNNILLLISQGRTGDEPAVDGLASRVSLTVFLWFSFPSPPLHQMSLTWASLSSLPTCFSFPSSLPPDKQGPLLRPLIAVVSLVTGSPALERVPLVPLPSLPQAVCGAEVYSWTESVTLSQWGNSE